VAKGWPWVGQQPFTTDTHVFTNLGDGTYFHSGLLALRQSIAAGVNITYKILYNDAVAMTGGQRVGERAEGHTVLQIMASLVSEGVSRLVIVTDEPAKYQGVPLLPGVLVQHRDELDRIQREFRLINGTSAIIYDQTCATEKRRRRKRGTLAEPDQRVVINAAVCEGCGDCGEQSNCLSVEPLETELGRKRRINQSSCNKDFSCIKGFCPSFVTVQGGQLKRPDRAIAQTKLDSLPPLTEPALPRSTGAWGIVVAGVGGTGVITIGQLLGMAAHLDGRAVVTLDAGGLAQKGGATWSFVQIADATNLIHSSKVEAAQADLVIGCDAIVAASKNTLAVMQAGRTFVALNTHATPTAAFVNQAQWQFPQDGCLAALGAAVGQEALGLLDGEQVASAALGDAIYTNPLMLGYAWQMGRIPLSLPALWRAFELNGVQVANNQAAFTWGRHCAQHAQAVQALLGQAAIGNPVAPDVTALIAHRTEFLTAYQNAAYAQRYRDLAEQVRQLDTNWGQTRLSDAVARSLFQLMAYKDEYEVARLHSNGDFERELAARFEGEYRLMYHLAPPILGKTDAQGHPVKTRFGPWLRLGLVMLARLKSLRGTRFDVFGRSPERQQERALILQYQDLVQRLMQELANGPQSERAAQRYALAVEIASVPQQIRGFGHVKARHLVAAQKDWQTLTQQLAQQSS
jgi:indolepyruvate ferredoxin oxidoreductase